MLDFIKKLFKKSKKSSHKKPSRPTQSCKAAHRPEYCCKKAENPQACPVKPVCEVKSVPDTKPTVAEPVEQVEQVKPDLPVEESREEPRAEKSVADQDGAYVIKALKGGIYKFDLTTPEGKTVVRSGEYTLKRSCVSGIQSVQKNGATENVEDRTAEKVVKAPNPKYEIFADDNEKYRFSLKAPNGYVILTSSAYASKKSCLKAIENVRAYSQTAKIEEQIKNK